MPLHEVIAVVRRPIAIGMLHVPALPGAPLNALSLPRIRERVLQDAAALVEAGTDALMLENFGDIPFFPTRVPAETVAQLTALALALRAAHPQVPLGINVLRNDGLSALAVAHAAEAAFIRVNVLCGARVTDQGVLQGIAHDLLRMRAALPGAGRIEILADVDVKHSAPLGVGRPVEVEVDDLLHRALADALIVSGTGTGKATDPQKVATVRAAARRDGSRVPVLVGSGASEENLPELAPHADGFIIGTSLKQAPPAGGAPDPAGPVDLQKARRFMARLRTLATR